jgi:CRISPR-associated protein Cas2
MIVIVLTAVKPGLRGDLTRWLLEVQPGVFCGKVSRRVRDRLWVRVMKGTVSGGSAVLVAAARDREQGYEILTAGSARWEPADFGGITLMLRPNRPSRGAVPAVPVPGP